MTEGISQSDLDALFAGLSDPGAEAEAKKEPKADESGGISQSDLDALFAGLGGGEGDRGPDVKEAVEIKMEEGWESPPPAEEAGGEALSQEEIDNMLAMFGKG
jgi:hypothetical protein